MKRDNTYQTLGFRSSSLSVPEWYWGVLGSILRNRERRKHLLPGDLLFYSPSGRPARPPKSPFYQFKFGLSIQDSAKAPSL